MRPWMVSVGEHLRVKGDACVQCSPQAAGMCIKLLSGNVPRSLHGEQQSIQPGAHLDRFPAECARIPEIGLSRSAVIHRSMMAHPVTGAVVTACDVIGQPGCSATGDASPFGGAEIFGHTFDYDCASAR
jgi:hypothetical protein